MPAFNCLQYTCIQYTLVHLHHPQSDHVKHVGCGAALCDALLILQGMISRERCILEDATEGITGSIHNDSYKAVFTGLGHLATCTSTSG